MGINLGILLGICSSLICWVTGVVVFRRLPTTFRLLVIHAFLACSIDILGVILVRAYGYHNNQGIFNFYMPFDFLLMLFAARIGFGKHFRLFSIIGISIFAVSWLLSLSINGPKQFANQALIVCAIVLTIAYFMVLLRNVHEERSHHTTGIYCISVSVMLYYCCTIPHFGLIHYFSNGELKLAGYYVNDALSVLRYIFTAIGLVYLSRPVTKSAVHAYQ